MLLAGDELGRTQQGNNNGYCQDNELSWVDWGLDDTRRALCDFAYRIVNYRRAHPNFHRHSFAEHDPEVGPRPETLRWFRADGVTMKKPDWENGGWMRTLGVFLDGNAAELRNAAEERVRDEHFFLIVNAHFEPVQFTLPRGLRRLGWRFAFDTARPALEPDAERFTARPPVVELEARSCVLLSAPNPDKDTAGAPASPAS
jgi:glycogen operon protein